jgi:hypothetical protein
MVHNLHNTAEEEENAHTVVWCVCAVKKYYQAVVNICTYVQYFLQEYTSHLRHTQLRTASRKTNGRKMKRARECTTNWFQ